MYVKVVFTGLKINHSNFSIQLKQCIICIHLPTLSKSSSCNFLCEINNYKYAQRQILQMFSCKHFPAYGMFCKVTCSQWYFQQNKVITCHSQSFKGQENPAFPQTRTQKLFNKKKTTVKS